MKNKGFTLVELIGVILILGIVVTIIGVSASKIISDNQKKTLRLSTGEIIDLMDSMATESGNTKKYYCFVYDSGNGNMYCDNSLNVFSKEGLSHNINKNKYYGYIVTSDGTTTNSKLCITDGKYYVRGTIDSYTLSTVADLSETDSSNLCNYKTDGIN